MTVMTVLAMTMLTTMMTVITDIVAEVELEMKVSHHVEDEDPPGGSRKRAREWRG